MTHGDLMWRHNDVERRWDLVREDAVRGMIYGDPRLLVGFVTDEMLARAPLTRDQMEQMILRKFKIPLPAEAYEGGD